MSRAAPSAALRQRALRAFVPLVAMLIVGCNKPAPKDTPPVAPTASVTSSPTAVPMASAPASDPSLPEASRAVSVPASSASAP